MTEHSDETGAPPPHGVPAEPEGPWHAPEAVPAADEAATDAAPVHETVTPVETARATEVRPAVAPAALGGAPAWLSLVLFLVLALGLFWVWSHPRAPEGNADVAALQHDVDALKQQVAELGQRQQDAAGIAQRVQSVEGRVTQLEKAPAPAPAAEATPAPANDEMGRKLDDLTGRVAALESRPAPASGSQVDNAAPAPAPAPDPAVVLKPQLDDLNARVARLERGGGGAARSDARMARAQAALTALDAGRPVGEVPGAPPEVARFATAAPPTETALREEFPAVAARIRAAMSPTGPGQTFLGRALARLERGITVREGDRVVVGAPEEATVERAESDVRNDDLAAAVAEIRKLSGAARQAGAEWADRAAAVVAARTALVQMAAGG